jgi:uncharacterized membrane protein YraQ (UPF0718 family)
VPNETETVSLFISNVIVRFSGILYEALPWVILGSVLAGIVQELPTRKSPVFMVPLGLAILIIAISPLPIPANLGIAAAVALVSGVGMYRIQGTTDRVLHMLSRRRGLAIVMSALLGLILPMCECGIITVMRRLHRKGMPLSCCTAYILAGPIINVVVLLTTYVAFYRQVAVDTVNGQTVFHMTRGWMVVMRAGLGFLVAIGAAFLVEWLYRRRGSSLLTASFQQSGLPVVEPEDFQEVRRPLYQRLSNISETAVHDILDITFYLVVGGLLAAGIREALELGQVGQAMVRDNAPLAIGSMMLLAFLVTLCSEADAFVASTFTLLGPAPKLAFLVLGPMLDLKLFLMYTRVFRPRLMFVIILAVVVQVFVLTLATHYLWIEYAPRWFQPAPGITGG